MSFSDLFVSTENSLTGPEPRIFERAGNKAGPITFQTPYEGHEDVVRYYLGYSHVQDGIIVRHLPVRHPKWRDMVAVRAEVRNVAHRGLDESISLSQAPLASASKSEFVFITLYFQSLDFELGELAGDADDTQLAEQPGSHVRTYATKKVTQAREIVTAVPGIFCWAASDGSPSDRQVQFPLATFIGYEDIRVTLYDWPYNALPISAIADCRNKVNDSTLELPNRPPPAFYPPDEIYLLTYDVADVFFPLGDAGFGPATDYRGINLTFFFKRREEGWNREPSPDGEFRLVFRKTSIGKASDQWKKKYKAADFSRLFRPEEA